MSNMSYPLTIPLVLSTSLSLLSHFAKDMLFLGGKFEAISRMLTCPSQETAHVDCSSGHNRHSVEPTQVSTDESI